MIVRAITSDGDFLFGKGKNDYRRENDAITQCIGTRLRSLLGNCFFDLGAGIDWFNLLGSKNQSGLNLALSAVILNTEGVIGLLQISSDLDFITRQFTVIYRVKTVYSTQTSTFNFNSVVGG
jgi:hypothetical protein